MTQQATAGHLVRVTQIGILHEFYYVAIADQAEAEASIARAVSTNYAIVKAVEPLSQAMLDGLLLAPGAYFKQPPV